MADDDAYDEAYGADGAPRSHYESVLGTLEAVDLRGLRGAIGRRLLEKGVTFRTGPGAEAFRIDPVPRIVTAAEWGPLAAGLAQRVRALNAFVVDAYGPRRIVEAGIFPAHAIEEAEGYEPDLQGRLPADAAPIGMAGLDVVREPGGAFQVLEDNLRTPSGFAYALAARRALAAELPGGGPIGPDLDDALPDLLGSVLAVAAGDREGAWVVLTNGTSSSAYYEHAQAAHRLGITLVTLRDLVMEDGRLHVGLGGGRTAPVAVVYRRSDEDRVRGDDGELTAEAFVLLRPWLDGEIGLVNAFGTGVADDKLAHAYVEDMIRFYLGEEPLIGSVPTLDLGVDHAVEQVLDDLASYVVKPRHGYGGHGVVVCAHATRKELEEVREALGANPGGHIAQRMVQLSTHPTVVGDGLLEPRHVDLRPFIFAPAGREPQVLPGGLTRVAMRRGSLVVNSSQDGGGKDTWVLPA